MAAPRVSVVIPTYNHARFLGAALESVRAQTMPDWEAVVVDNFSTDDTASVVRAFADPRVRRVEFANQGIIAASRNHGISLTGAPCVAFLDSDDSWHPEKLARSLERLSAGADLVCHGERWIGPGPRSRKVRYGPAARATYDSLLFDGNCISTSAVVVRREHLERAGGFSEDPEFNTAEDYDLWLKIAAGGARIEFLDELLGNYLLHDANQSRSPLRNMHAVMAVFERHLGQLAPGAVDAARVARRRGTICYGGARSLQAAGQFAEARRYYLRSLRLNPWRATTWAGMLLNTLHARL